MGRIKQLLRIHLDIPTIVLLAVGFLFIHRPLCTWLLSVLGWLDAQTQFPQWASTLAQGVAANILSATIVVPIAVWILRIRHNAAAAGRFKAVDVTNGKNEEWGEVVLSYNLFTTKIRGTLTHKDIVMRLDAVFDRYQYLRGHYTEESNIARRRLGAFLLRLSGDGDGYRGPFVFVDPVDENDTPKTGSVEWRRISE